ncbi:methyltransferase domain-containing protein [Notoacmeibacter ruber]|uniref:Methyltransferase domain-containing protein n=1 Tax=Notoacmeibacter ruber TaxID=2670375 RepID=A0A3L7JLI2_9HYPH|nr:methyltransferase domain-containing protein [Notoacmeibacter ruber]
MEAGEAIDNEALAEAYELALSLEKTGERAGAIEAWRAVLALDPADHGGAAIRLAALGAEAPPRRMPDAYVETLFDQHASAFDDILVEQLGYTVPVLLAEALRKAAPGPYERGLDLGCGTGLTGGALSEFVTTFIGLDISEAMVAEADDRDVYDGLYVAEAEDFLENIGDAEDDFDLIVATDVLPYIGDPTRLFAGMARKARPSAVVGFSTESFEAGDGEAGYRVLPTHRYAHDPVYIAEELEKVGFELLYNPVITVRMEQGNPAPGYLFLARKN